MDNLRGCLLLCVVAVATYSSLTEAYEDDAIWLEKILAAPRITLNNIARWNTRHKRHSTNFDVDDLVLQEILLSRFSDANILRKSRRKRSGWITDDPLNRGADTTTARPVTHAATAAPPPPTTTTTTSVPTTTTTTTTTTSAPTTTTTSAPTTQESRRNTVLPPNFPGIPSNPGIPPFWPHIRMPVGWGKRRRRRAAVRREDIETD